MRFEAVATRNLHHSVGVHADGFEEQPPKLYGKDSLVAGGSAKAGGWRLHRLDPVDAAFVEVRHCHSFPGGRVVAVINKTGELDDKLVTRFHWACVGAEEGASEGSGPKTGEFDGLEGSLESGSDTVDMALNNRTCRAYELLDEIMKLRVRHCLLIFRIKRWLMEANKRLVIYWGLVKFVVKNCLVDEVVQ